MIYVIKNKPYVKVANYYKEVKIVKIGNGYSVTPAGGKETRLENVDYKEVSEMPIEDFYAKKPMSFGKE